MKRLLNKASAREGQIAIPALFLFPTMMLFVYLIIETAKLSREKIRHQFAVDAASFIEMTNYSDFLNRSAYVNGAFPMRIFWEGFHGTELECYGRADCLGKKSLDNILYDDGVFPRSQEKPDPDEFEKARKTQWDILYGGSRASDMNSDSPEVGRGCLDKGIPDCMTLISYETARKWNIRWEEANQVYKLHVQIYQLLGSVESAQFSVLKRLSQDHNFLKKSYWLNTGGEKALEGAAGAASFFDREAHSFTGSAVEFHCVQRMNFYGNQSVRSFGQPYQIYAPDDPPTMPNTISDCTGLFQLVTVNKNVVKSMRDPRSAYSKGWPVEAHWEAPGNYFNVPLNSLMPDVDGGPKVHATVSVDGFGAKPAVWPNPTPKFQVRLYP